VATRELDEILRAGARNGSVVLEGERAADRYGDDELAQLASFSLRSLVLFHQRISRLPALQPTLTDLTLGNLRALDSLDGIEAHVQLQSLALTEVPVLDRDEEMARLAELPELTSLRLGNASLRVLPAVIANLPSLVELALDRCTQLDLDDAFEKLARTPALQILRISGATVLPDAVAKLARLRVLDLGHGKLKGLPASIGRLDALEELDISHNPIKTLPDELCTVRTLRVLRAEDVGLKKLPSKLGRLASLEDLRVTGDHLSGVPSSIGDLRKLRTLHLPEHVDVPDSIYRLSLESFEGPSDVAKQLSLQPLSTPLTDHLEIDDPRMPADFGDPLSLVIRLPDHDAPIPQLSALRRLASIEIDVMNIADALARVAHCQYLRRARIVTHQGGVLPAALASLSNLQQLVVARHRATKLPEAIGHLAHLAQLTLHLPNLVELPVVGDQLRELRLETPGQLVALPATLARCHALATIEIGGVYQACKLQDLDVLGRLPALRRFSFTRNRDVPVLRILRALAGAPIEDLDLSESPIVTLPSEIGGLARLRKLHLHDTYLDDLPVELRACRELRYVSLPLARLPRVVVKDYLPPGRWRKGKRDDVTFYERTDA
jgi:leucine-rich repeat protein SHOC2